MVVSDRTRHASRSHELRLTLSSPSSHDLSNITSQEQTIQYTCTDCSLRHNQTCFTRRYSLPPNKPKPSTSITTTTPMQEPRLQPQLPPPSSTHRTTNLPIDCHERVSRGV